jgi:hypothetical protein
VSATPPSPLNSIEYDTQPAPESFIVKIWLDNVSQKGKRIDWHGSIIHVPGGEKRYIRSLSTAIDFIEETLDHAGARVSWLYGLKIWLHHW